MKNKGKKRIPKHAKPIEITKPKEPSNIGVYFIIIFIVLIFAAAFISWDKFTIREIEINGINDVKYLDVINLTGIEYMNNIFSVNLKDIEKRIAQNPILEVISIKRILPYTIEINVIERKPIAVIKALDKYVVLNNKCIALGILDSQIISETTIIKGVVITSYKLGEIIVFKSSIKIEKLQKLLFALEKTNTNDLIKDIDFNLTENIKLTTHAGYEIQIGNIENIEKKCNWIKTMIPKLIEKGEIGGVLYITNVNTAHYISEIDE